MLKQLRLIIAIPIAVFISFDNAVVAAYGEDTAKVEDSVCFMIAASGRVIDLSNLCGPQSAKTNLTTQSAKTKLAKGVFQVPIKRRRGGVPVVDVTFNGKQTFEMLVDTGASNIVLTPQMAAAVGFTPTGVGRSSTANGVVNTVIGHITSVDVAGAVINNPEVEVNPTLDVGLLGENFFKDYDVTVREKVIEFRVRYA